MFFFIVKNKLLLSRTISILSPSSSSSSSHHLIKSIFSFSTSTIRKSTKSEQNLLPSSYFNLTDYLINSCGLSLQQALMSSKLIAHIQSSSKPDAVLGFLKDYGFGDANIAGVIFYDPKILCKGIKRTLKPKFKVLEKMGFSATEIVELVSANPAVIKVNTRSKMESLKEIFGSNQNILKASARCSYLFTSSLSNKILPNVSLLRNCGISDHKLQKLLLGRPNFLTRSTDNVKVVIKRVEALGVPPESNMFYKALMSISCTTEAKLEFKLQLWRSYGLSVDEAHAAICKYPVLIAISEEKLGRTIDFLTRESGLSISYVASHGKLFTFSLKSRLIPRVFVLKIVNMLSERILCSAMNMKNEKFMEKFVFPHKELLPELEEFYISACSGKFAH